MADRRQGSDPAAAGELLGRDGLPGGAVESVSNETGAGVAGDRLLLRVVVGSGEVALPADEIVEVLTAAPLARVPGAPAEVAGVVNRRGGMLTVIDLGEALGQEPAAADPEHRVVVVRFGDKEAGIAVRDVLRLVGAAEVADGEGGPGRRQRPLRVVELEPLLGPVFRSAG